jgi:molybdopterin-guanine dinucleotide biosynthesis protein A
MPEFSVAILAGGESRRMGTDKALLQVGGQSLIERVIEVASPIADECMVIANSSAPFSHLHLPVHPDKAPGLGPLAGLQAALANARNDTVLLLACDLPFLTRDFLLYAVASIGQCQAAIPRDRGGRLQPVCAAYATSCVTFVERALAGGRRSMGDFVGDLDLHILEPEEWQEYDPDGLLFTNVNTPADFARAVESLKCSAD